MHVSASAPPIEWGLIKNAPAAQQRAASSRAASCSPGPARSPRASPRAGSRQDAARPKSFPKMPAVTKAKAPGVLPLKRLDEEKGRGSERPPEADTASSHGVKGKRRSLQRSSREGDDRSSREGAEIIEQPDSLLSSGESLPPTPASAPSPNTLSQSGLSPEWKSVDTRKYVSFAEPSQGKCVSEDEEVHLQIRSLSSNGTNATTTSYGRAMHSSRLLTELSESGMSRSIQVAPRTTNSMLHRLRDAQCHVLKTNTPEMALVTDYPGTIPQELHVRARACLNIYGEPYELLVLQLNNPSKALPMSVANRGGVIGHLGDIREDAPAAQLGRMNTIIDRWKPFPENGPFPVAVHSPPVQRALMAREALHIGLEKALDSSRWQRFLIVILHVFRFFAAPEDGELLSTFREQYGADSAFFLAWSYFYVQQLWILAIFCVVWVAMGIEPASDFSTKRIPWAVATLGVIIWGWTVTIIASVKFDKEHVSRQLQEKATAKAAKKNYARRSTVNPSFVVDSLAGSCGRWTALLVVATPVVLIFCLVCILSLVLVTNLILHIIYVWGDCLHLHTPETPCRDAELKYHIFGWAAETACDVLLAIIFEALFALGKDLSEWIAGLRNFRHKNDHQHFASMLCLYFAAMERIGFVGSLAFAFVPQWEEPSGFDGIDNSVDCSDLLFGDSDYRCFQRKLPVEIRRWVFYKLMTGPFMVAPWVAMGVKVLLPYVMHAWTRICDNTTERSCRCLGPGRAFVRFFTLVFTYECDNVRCFKFVTHGWPFRGLEEDDYPSKKESEESMTPQVSPGSSEELPDLRGILDQMVRKQFEPADELVELEMSFLWVACFTPIMPHGVLVTLAAKILEIHFSMVKMLYIRRRPVPISDKVMRRQQSGYLFAVMTGCIGWYVGLSLITYNDELYLWSWYSKAATGASVVFWLCASACAGLTKMGRHGFSYIINYFQKPTPENQSTRLTETE